MNRIMSSIVGVIAVIAMTFGVPGRATAILILDQENVIDTSGSNWTSDQIRQLTTSTFDQYAQTFTVGVAGTLSRVDVEAYHVSATHGPLLVNLWRTTAGVPDPSVSLADWSISDLNSSTTVGSLVSLDLGAAAFPVLLTEVYAIAFSPDFSYTGGVGGRYWVRGTSDPYPGGNSYGRTIDSSYNGVSSFQEDPSDYGFRTWVNVQGTAVPEPSTMILLGSGLIGLVGYGRKKFFKK